MKKAITTTMTMIAFSLMITGCNEKGKGIDAQEEKSNLTQEKADSRFAINKDEVKKEEKKVEAPVASASATVSKEVKEVHKAHKAHKADKKVSETAPAVSAPVTK